MEVATFGAGCFWGVEFIFKKLNGVTDTAVGYQGGASVDPTYREVCTGATGHAEVCRVTYDPTVVSYEKLLRVFWKIHDPTQLNRQGPDVGTQYRTVIFYHTPEQKELAERSKRELEESGVYEKPIATIIEEAGKFYSAEEYHQDYFNKNTGTCHIDPGLDPNTL